MVVDEAEVVEHASRQASVELVHQLPRAVADADDDDADRVLGGVDDRIDGRLFLRHLSVGNDDEDVVSRRVLGRRKRDRLAHDGREAGRAGERDAPRDVRVPLEHVLEAAAQRRRGVGAEAEHRLVRRRAVTEPVRGHAALVGEERPQRLAEDGDHALVGVLARPAHAMQAALREALAALPLVAGAEVDADG